MLSQKDERGPVFGPHKSKGKVVPVVKNMVLHHVFSNLKHRVFNYRVNKDRRALPNWVIVPFLQKMCARLAQIPDQMFYGFCVVAYVYFTILVKEQIVLWYAKISHCFCRLVGHWMCWKSLAERREVFYIFYRFAWSYWAEKHNQEV